MHELLRSFRRARRRGVLAIVGVKVGVGLPFLIAFRPGPSAGTLRPIPLLDKAGLDGAKVARVLSFDCAEMIVYFLAFAAIHENTSCLRAFWSLPYSEKPIVF